jgi:hypothetical protein
MVEAPQLPFMGRGDPHLGHRTAVPFQRLRKAFWASPRPLARPDRTGKQSDGQSGGSRWTPHSWLTRFLCALWGRTPWGVLLPARSRSAGRPRRPPHRHTGVRTSENAWWQAGQKNSRCFIKPPCSAGAVERCPRHLRLEERGSGNDQLKASYSSRCCAPSTVAEFSSDKKLSGGCL